jgi:PiT family inorganic phosphate transporter
MALALLLLLTLFVAYSNGANDNFKGVATLFGSGTATYKSALWLATATTFAGAVASVFFAQGLVKAFSGKGLVPDTVAASPQFLLAVAAGAGCTVLLATLLGFPVSTTHGLTGALVGAGFLAAGQALNLKVLGAAFFAPLLVSPLLSVALTVPLYWAMHAARTRMAIDKETCVCVGETAPQLVQLGGLGGIGGIGTASAFAPSGPGLGVNVGTTADCVEKYTGRVLGVSAQRLLDAGHYATAGIVSFARGLNDTPKIVGLLLVVKALDLRVGMLAIALAMATGGLLNARKVAQTMSRKIAKMNDGQAFTANLVTGCLVIFASRLGMPVSTTHVSVGAITGVGLVNHSADKRVLFNIVLSWVLTLPIAAIISAAAYFILHRTGIAGLS